MKKGLIRKHTYIDKVNEAYAIEIRVVGILVYKRSVSFDFARNVGLKSYF